MTDNNHDGDSGRNNLLESLHFPMLLVAAFSGGFGTNAFVSPFVSQEAIAQCSQQAALAVEQSTIAIKQASLHGEELQDLRDNIRDIRDGDREMRELIYHRTQGFEQKSDADQKWARQEKIDALQDRRLGAHEKE